ncbi:MAG: cupin domain-containing protein [Oscillospiraceae bacterium]|jgi:mannose-6-phosphate isomerase-like protein (cupin superfamily)|nr:cupin domain-containing protein [Oscillospiraceae bacterium]
MAGFQPVPGHVGFLAKGVFGQADRVLDVSIARLEPGGGGPEPPHRHPERDHLFIVTEGTMEARLPEGVRRFGPDEALLVRGAELHEIWNAGSTPAVVVGISLRAGASD